MSKPAQTAANRRNATRSTGPRTRAGKATASRNALQHGLLAKDVVIRNENPQAFIEWRDALVAHLQPVGAMEDLLVERIAACAWRLRRAGIVEASLFRHQGFDQDAARARRQAADLEITTGFDITKDMLAALNTTIKDPKKHGGALRQAAKADAARDRETLATAFIRDATCANALSKLARYETALERSLYKALHELERRQAARAGRTVPVPAVVEVDVSRQAG